MSRLKLKHWQRRRLQRQLRETSDVRLYRKTLAILELDRGRSAADLAQMLGVTRQTVHNWAAAYARQSDPAALADHYGQGRPQLVTEDIEDLLRLLLTCSPQDLGYPATDWTTPLLQEELASDMGRRPSDDTVRRALHRLGYIWKRPRYVLEPDPQREKKRRIRRQIRPSRSKRTKNNAEAGPSRGSEPWLGGVGGTSSGGFSRRRA